MEYNKIQSTQSESSSEEIKDSTTLDNTLNSSIIEEQIIKKSKLDKLPKKLNLKELKNTNSSVTSNNDSNSKIDPKNNIFPYCIVWTQLPLISFFFPFIGHTGICDSNGKIYDFAGSCIIGEDELSFGDPIKYVKLKPTGNWDSSLNKANDKYSCEDHNLFCNNCHSHVACALNNMKYGDKSNYTMIHIWWYCLINSTYVSYGDIIKTYFGWFIMLCVYILVKYFNN